ncbi:hypothetical protein [Pedobacter sp. KBW06]|uniref:hypothetical protein n=1 Tax=Pedobacter sp. KBW06 TaxID=2153359 RepID=UPI000F5975D1|nr:hypothetical protein [Pedobacter sp. KBW06]
MSRQSNPGIKFDDPKLAAFMSLLEKIFIAEEITTQVGKSNYLVKLSQRTVNDEKPLSDKMLERDLFRPITKKEYVTLSPDYARKLANSVLTYFKSSGEAKDTYDLKINDFRNLYNQGKMVQALEKGKDFKTMCSELLEHHTGLESFTGRKFLVYERMGDEKDSSWGITIGMLTLAKAANYIEATLEFKFEQEVRRNIGIATRDSKSDYMFIDLLPEGETGRRTNMVIRLGDAVAHDYIVLLGHYTRRAANERLVTKSVIVQALNPKITLKDIGNYANKTAGYKKTPVEFRSYLYDRKKNLLSQPNNRIQSLVELRQFLQRHKVKNKHLLFFPKDILGKFKVYFKRANDKIVKDHIKITLNEMTGRADGEFMHSPAENDGSGQKWFGQVSVHNKSDVCIMNLINEESVKSNVGKDEEPVLITFCLPKPTFKLSEVQCFQGLITGLEDEQHGIVAYRCLIVRESCPQPSAERLAEIFKNEHPLLVGASRQQKYMLDNFQFS